MTTTPCELRGPVFIGGTGRSGTTVFARLLGTHPNIFTVRWESQFIVAKHGLLDLVEARFASAELDAFLCLLRGRWFRRTLNAGKPNEYDAGLCDDVSLEALTRGIERLEASLQAETRTDGNRLAADLVTSLFEEPARSAGATRWCEKTPRNSLYVDRLWRIFPEARFINVIRDGRDVACSMVERQFWPIGATHDFPTTSRFRGEVTLEKAIDYWVEMIRLAREVASRIPAHRYLEVRLEDLINAQETTVRRVLDFVDEPFDNRLVTFPLRTSPIGRWREELKQGEIRHAASHAGAALSRAGYHV